MRFARLAATLLAALAVAVGPSVEPGGAQVPAGPPTDVLVGFTTPAAMEGAIEGDLGAIDPGVERLDDLTATASLTPAEIEALDDDPSVTAIEPDAPAYAAEVVNDPCYTSGCANGSAYQINQLELPSAWNLSHGAGAVVAVIDSGVDEVLLSTNPDLAGKIVADVAASTVTGPECTSQAQSSHGTAVSTMVAAQPNNGVGTAGSGWDARVLSIRVFEVNGASCVANISSIIAAIDQAIGAGVEVINLSLTTASDSSLLRSAVGRALAAGIPVVAAAGNSGSTSPSAGQGGYPAFYPEVLSVGYLTATGERSAQSNFGPWVDVYAAGSAVPAYNRLGMLQLFSGSSFASPAVAGVVALMRSTLPSATPATIEEALRNTSAAVPGTPGGLSARAFGAILALPTADVLARDSATAGSPDRMYSYGLSSYRHLHCDFDGDGIAGIVAFASGTWAHRQSSSAGPAATFAYGAAGYVPVCGNWDGLGGDGIGVFVNGTWYLRNSATAGPPELAVPFGTSGYVPVVGDWDGDGTDGIGVYVGGTWYLRAVASPGPPQATVAYGTQGYVPVVGDWNGGGGPDGIGVYVGGAWYLRESPSPGPPQRSFAFGSGAAVPITGATGTPGLDGIGVVYP